MKHPCSAMLVAILLAACSSQSSSTDDASTDTISPTDVAATDVPVPPTDQPSVDAPTVDRPVVDVSPADVSVDSARDTSSADATPADAPPADVTRADATGDACARPAVMVLTDRLDCGRGMVTCPSGYECLADEGVVLQQFCGRSCHSDCDCPATQTCGSYSDKAGMHSLCVSP